MIDTSRSAPEDISEPDHGESLSSIRYKVAARSVVVLVRRRSDKVKPQGNVDLCCTVDEVGDKIQTDMPI